MTVFQTDDLRIASKNKVNSPKELIEKYPITENASATVHEARAVSHDIIHGKDDRLLVIVGPCSIHDPKAAKEYASKLMVLREKLKDDLYIVMRVYFEKPRTNIGWKGLINDPTLTGEFKINEGLAIARELLLELSDNGMPAATEYLDLISPQYISDLISWAAIGARTTESQGHRELASGVSCPVGFKNGTYGNIDIAVNAVSAAVRPHHFMSTDKNGHTAIFSTTGNEDAHIILRGGKNKTNYDADSVNAASEELKEHGHASTVMVDFSHSNSGSDFNKQPEVATVIAEQIRKGSHNISGVMIESHLVEGKQNAKSRPLEELTYGQSITDACISWDTTEQVLEQLAEAIRVRREIQ